ncbi:MAG: hypothetical protein H7833_03980 [Magnetococcus sp. DMHC-1]
MALYPLIMKWWASPHLELRHLARNFMLDVEVTASNKVSHPDVTTHGNRLQAADVADLYAKVSIILAHESSEDVEGILRQIGGACRLENEARLSRSRSGHGAGSQRVEVARYLSMRDVFSYWYAEEVGNPVADARTVLDFLRRKPPNPPVGPTAGGYSSAQLLRMDATLSGGPVCWVTVRDQDGFFPHEDADFHEISSEEKAPELVRRLALPGLVTEEDRQDAVGMMVALYSVASQDLLPPDILDAESSWYFFPGPMGMAFGQTAPMDTDYRAPWLRSHSQHPGYREYVHKNMTLQDVKPALQEIGTFREAFGS